MKNLLSIIFFGCCVYTPHAQILPVKKQPTVGLHFFYNDFQTASLFKTTSIGEVLKNKTWNKPRNMEGGFGLDYLKGITDKIDLTATINTSWVNYLLPSGTLYGSSNFLLDLNAGTHIKLLADKHVFTPYLITKIGYTAYKKISGFSLLPGAGIQVNLFNEAFILSTIEYRLALNNSLSNQLYYSVGIATSITNKKTNTLKKPIIKPVIIKELKPITIIVSDTIKKAIKIPIKDIVITVIDEATEVALQFVEVTIKNNNGIELKAISNLDGKVIFNNIKADDYIINGWLNKIATTTATVIKNNFDSAGNQIAMAITHNDPRFTLVGNTVDKTAGTSVDSAEILITNTSFNNNFSTTSASPNGQFRIPLDAASDFTVVGKKAGFISTIENISTKGLNRSVVLYIKLQLNIEDTKTGKSIVLNKIYFETGKTDLKIASSSDLNKLVQFLKDNIDTKLEIKGHTDNSGSILNNAKLSQLRAENVMVYLVGKGIDPARLLAKGFGSSIPIESNATETGKARNRRVEIMVIK